LNVFNPLDILDLVDEPEDFVGHENFPLKGGLKRRRKRVGAEVFDDLSELREIFFEPGQGLLSADLIDADDGGRCLDPLLHEHEVPGGDVGIEEEDHDHVLRQLAGDVLKVVGQGEKHSQDEERQTDDGNGKEVSCPVLPKAVGRVVEEIS
jgi:hypothetical protein